MTGIWDGTNPRWRRYVIVSLVLMIVLGGVFLGVSGPWLSTTEVVVPADCEGWNTEDYFEDATASGVENCLQLGADVHARTADGITPLTWAARNSKDPDVIGVLVHAGADANEYLEIERKVATPLLIAASRRDGTAVIGALIAEGADPNLHGYEGLTPLHVAASRKQWETVSLLLDHGAEVGAVDDNGRTPLSTVTRFSFGKSDNGGFIANVISTISILLNKGAIADQLTRYNWTDLHTVALIGTDPDEVSALVNQGSDPNAETSSGWTALHLAAFNNENPDIIAALLVSGADPDGQFGDGRTPLHCAAFGNPNPLVISALLAGGADPNAMTKTGWTPLHAAAFANPSPDVITALLSGGANANVRIKASWTNRDLYPWLFSSRPGVYVTPDFKADDRSEFLITLDGNMNSTINGLTTPLHVAVEFPRNPSVVAALTLGGADPNARDVEGETPLHNVENLADMVTLIEAGSDLNARDEDGHTPLHRAAGFHHIDMVSTLIEHGADTNAVSNTGWTPLHRAAHRDNAAFQVISLLIRRGANSNAKDVYGTTPLHWAADSKITKASVIDALTSGGADPNTRNKKGETPLFNAVAPSFHYIGDLSNHAVVTRLIDAGADPNLLDGNGSTPLHRALVYFSDALIIEALLDGGANAASVDADGLTPWDIAQQHQGIKGTKTYWRLNDARFD